MYYEQTKHTYGSCVKWCKRQWFTFNSERSKKLISSAGNEAVREEKEKNKKKPQNQRREWENFPPINNFHGRWARKERKKIMLNYDWEFFCAHDASDIHDTLFLSRSGALSALLPIAFPCWWLMALLISRCSRLCENKIIIVKGRRKWVSNESASEILFCHKKIFFFKTRSNF